MASERQIGNSPESYGSARDLPSFVEARQQLRFFKGLTRFVMRHQRAEFIQLEQQMNEMADSVDLFYERLGSRHWTYNDWMSVKEVDAILDESSTSAEAEGRLIEMYQDPDVSDRHLLRLRNIEGLFERYHLLVRAREDYDAGRFDTCTILLITVMDGFVNDFEAGKRKGLAARSADEMVAWDSVTGHHLGLTNALKPYLRTIKKRIDEEVFEVHRHGIVHGAVVNYNNVIVATKAWNLLFAVVDWSKATTMKAKEDEKPPDPGWREMLGLIAERGRKEKARAQFVTRTIRSEDIAFSQDDVVAKTEAFVDAWQRCQWGLLVPVLPPNLIGAKSMGEAAQCAKSWFGPHQISDVEIDRVDYTQSSVAEVAGVARIDETTGHLQLRWMYCDSLGAPSLNGEDGNWFLAVVAPHTYLVDEFGSRLN